MSLWKFENFEAEIDLTDVDVAERLESAQCFTVYFDTIFGDGTMEKILQGKRSLGKCLEAADSFYAFVETEDKSVSGRYDKYRVQNRGNRQQRRNQKYHKNQNYGRR